MKEVPEINEVMSKGQNEASSQPTEIIIPDPFPSHVSDVLSGLSANDHRKMGDVGTAQIVSALFHEAREEIKDLKIETKSLRNDLDNTKKELAETNTINAVLVERVSSLTHLKHIKNFVIMAGSILIPIGYSFMGTSYPMTILLIALGLLLILGAWFSSEKGNDQ